MSQEIDHGYDLPAPYEILKRLPEVTFEPLHNWLLVVEVDSTSRLASGLVVPGAMYGTTFRRGVVICVGPGTYYGQGTFVPHGLKRGDVVVFGKSGGMEVMLDEGSFLLMRENEVMGKIRLGEGNATKHSGAANGEAGSILPDA